MRALLVHSPAASLVPQMVLSCPFPDSVTPQALPDLPASVPTQPSTLVGAWGKHVESWCWAHKLHYVERQSSGLHSDKVVACTAQADSTWGVQGVTQWG